MASRQPSNSSPKSLGSTRLSPKPISRGSPPNTRQQASSKSKNKQSPVLTQDATSSAVTRRKKWHMPDRCFSSVDSPSPISPIVPPRSKALTMLDMSDVSSCCSFDDFTTDESSRNSPSGSPISGSFCMPIEELKKKYKREFCSAIRSDYRYLMGEEIIDTCRSTESDLSMDSDDLTTDTTITYNEFVRQYKELSDWLGNIQQQVVQRQTISLSEKYLNQTYHEEMMLRFTRRAQFEDYAKQLMKRFPTMRDEVAVRLNHVTDQWSSLEKVVMSNGSTSDSQAILKDIKSDVTNLGVWVNEVDSKLQGFRLEPNLTVDVLKEVLEKIQLLKLEVDSKSKVAPSVVKLCDLLTQKNKDSHHAFSREPISMKLQAIDLQHRWEGIFILCLEWQMRLEEMIASGPQVRSNRSENDDQWDALSYTEQRRQYNRLPALPEDSCSMTDASSYLTDGALDESDCDGAKRPFTASTPAGCLRDSVLGRSVSDPALNGNSQKVAIAEFDSDSVDPEKNVDGHRKGNLAERSELVRGMGSPGQLRRSMVVGDLTAVLDGALSPEKLEAFDVGYASEGHSNEDNTDGPSGRKSLKSIEEDDDGLGRGNHRSTTSAYNTSSDYSDSSGIALKNHTNGLKKNLFGKRTNLNVADLTTDSAQSDRPDVEDGSSFPGSEDELPLDDVPLARGGRLEKSDVSKSLDSFPKNTAKGEDLAFEYVASDGEVLIQKSGLLPGVIHRHKAVELASPELSFDLPKFGIDAGRSFASSCCASSEGTEEFTDGMSDEDKRNGATHKRRSKGCRSTRSSPIKEMSSPQKTPTKRTQQDLFDHQMEKSQRWLSDGNINDDAVKSKVRRTSSDVIVQSDQSPSSFKKRMASLELEVKLRRRNLMQSSRLFRKGQQMDYGGDRASPLQVVPSKDGRYHKEALLNISPQEFAMSDSLADQMVPNFEMDDVCADIDVLDSSIDEQMNSEDDFENSKERNVDMWLDDSFQHHDAFYQNNQRCFYSTPKGAAGLFPSKPSAGMRQRQLVQDSDSDAEDFQNVLSESLKALEFTRSTIDDFQKFQDSGSTAQDPNEYLEPLATCQTNILCLQELLEALELAEGFDAKLSSQIEGILKQWKCLESEIITFQSEARQQFAIHLELIAVERDIWIAEKNLKLSSLTDIRKVDKNIETVEQFQKDFVIPITKRLESWENNWRRYKEANRFENQLTDTDFKLEAVKKAAGFLTHRCETEISSLHSALMTFYKFSEIEKELMYNMSQELHQIECLDAAKDVVDFIDRDLLDNINDLKSLQVGWSKYDDQLKSLLKHYSDLMGLYPESSLDFVKREIGLTCSSLTTLKRKNRELGEVLVKKQNECCRKNNMVVDESPAEHFELVNSGQLLNKSSGPPKIRKPVEQNAGVMRMIGRLLKYALPLSVVVLLFGWFYLEGYCNGDGTMTLFPSMQHIRGSPPS